MKKILRCLLPAFLLAALVIPLMPATPVLAVVVDEQVEADSDDVLRRIDPDYWDLSNAYQMAGATTGSPTLGGGMRFIDVAIPQGATITTAYLIFKCARADAGTVVNTRISADDTDDAATFTTSANFDARWATRTTAKVNWDAIPAWSLDEEGPDTTSPEIKTVIQEIVDREGWESGNDIAIFWEDFEERSTEAADVRREAYSHNNSPANAPKLHIEYSQPAVTTNDATLIGDSFATLNGNLTDLGGEGTVYCFFQYGKTTAYGTDTSEQTRTSIGAYSQAITSLDFNVVYHFRAAVRYDTDKYVYGADKYFIAVAEQGDFKDFIYEEQLLDTHGWQGVASDGTYLYTVSSDQTIYKWTKGGSEVTSHADGHLDGTNMAQINSIHYYNNKLYIGSSNYPTAPNIGYIKVFNASDLSYVEEHIVKAYHCEGTAFHDNAWWVVYHNWPYVSKYDATWNWVADYDTGRLFTGADGTAPQGIIWYGDYIYLNNHGGSTWSQTIDVYEWNGSGFDQISRLDRPTKDCRQGLGLEPDGSVLWWAERCAVDGFNNIVESTIIFATLSPTEEIYYSTSSDGKINSTDTDWVGARSGTGLVVTAGTDNTTVSAILDTGVYDIDKTFLYFNTADIPDDATIIHTQLSLYESTTESVLKVDEPSVIVQNGQPIYPHDPLIIGDFDRAYYTGNGGTRSLNTISYYHANTWAPIDLTADGRSWINKTGVTKLMITTTMDVYNMTPTDENYVVFYTNEKSAGYIPKLTIEYIVAVETDPATDIGETSATLNGDAKLQVDRRGFEWGLTTAYGESWYEDDGPYDAGVYDHGITGLTGSETYHFRATVYYGGTWINGDDDTFNTSAANTPTVSTGDAASVAGDSATLQGTLTSMGASSTVYVSFEWGLTAGYGYTTDEQTKTAIGGFNEPITGLVPNTTYYFRARVRYDSTYAYGSSQTFITSSLGAPTITTNNAASISSTRATLQGTLNSLGDHSPVYAFFEWGLTDSYGAVGSPTTERTMTAAGGFNELLTELEPGTTYHFRARVRYGDLYVDGADKTFVTPTAGAPGIDAPDIFRIDDVKVFRDYFEGEPLGQLYVITYRIVYEPWRTATPTSDVSDYFDFQLLDGTTLKAQVPVKMWNYRPGCIYLRAESAPEWGESYRVKIIGAPDKWDDPPPECYRDLTSGDWQGDDLVQLDNWVLSLAESFQSYYDVQYVIHSGAETVLSQEGGARFNMGILGLSKVRPHLFYASSSWVDVEPVEHVIDPEGTMTMDNMGEDLLGLFEDAAVIIDVETEAMGGIIFGVIFLIAFVGAGAVFKNVQLAGLGLVAGPAIAIGANFGLLAPALAFTAVLVLIFFILKVTWLRSG